MIRQILSVLVFRGVQSLYSYWKLDRGFTMLVMLEILSYPTRGFALVLF